MTIAIYKRNIDQKLEEILKNPIFVYGGITEQSLKDRKYQHVYDKQPLECDNTWIMEKLTTINITTNRDIDYYKKLISEVEQYLINKLNNTFGNKCVNNKTKNNTIAQQGGKGQQPNFDDVIQVYVFYKPYKISFV